MLCYNSPNSLLKLNSTMTKTVNFHTPVIQAQPHSLLEWIEDKADLYLSVTNKLAHIIPGGLHNQSPVVEIKKTPWTVQNIVLTTLKVMSYVIFILPIIALAFKIHKKQTHQYYIFTYDPSIDLVKKGFIDHSTITSVLSHQRKLLYDKKKNYYFVQKADVTDFSKPFSLKPSKKIPADMNVSYPEKGGLCLSIHMNNHFVALFVDFKKKKMFYYNSFGSSMCKKIEAFAEKVKVAVFKETEEIKTISVNKCHQYDGENCGRYAINFLKEMMSSSNPENTVLNLRKQTLSSQYIYQKGVKWADELETNYVLQFS